MLIKLTRTDGTRIVLNVDSIVGAEEADTGGSNISLHGEYIVGVNVKESLDQILSMTNVMQKVCRYRDPHQGYGGGVGFPDSGC